MESIQHKLEFAAVCVLVVLSIVLLPLLASALLRASQQSMLANSNELSSSANAVSRSLDSVADFTASVAGNAAAAAQSTANFVSNTTQSVGSFVVTVGQTAATGILTASTFVGKTTLQAIVFTVNIPDRVSQNITGTQLVSAMIRPVDAAALPVIDGKTDYQPASEVSTKSTTPKKQLSAPVWPMHGAITTMFGVPEPPYQPIHTGLDISDGNPSGVTPIHPYKSGKVIDVVHSSRGLGNRVVVDHGGGFTSVYGHLASTSVKVGQKVQTTDVLGRQGSTGVSTGPHLHFEILKNGFYVNPLDYIKGRP